jgi:hypothetical protein
VKDLFWQAGFGVVLFFFLLLVVKDIIPRLLAPVRIPE